MAKHFKTTFHFTPLPSFFLFLSVSPSFSFAMQPEKAVSSEEKTKKKKKRKKEGSKRGNGGGEGKRRRGGNGSRMVICEEVLMTSLPPTPLCSLSICHLQYEIHHCRILPTKRVALCPTKRVTLDMKTRLAALPATLPWEGNFSACLRKMRCSSPTCIVTAFICNSES